VTCPGRTRERRLRGAPPRSRLPRVRVRNRVKP
jgi:hypothetical protein